MSRLLLRNLRILDPASDPVFIERGFIVVRGDEFEAVGEMDALPGGEFDEVIDLTGRTALPGMVNGHTHLYSTLALGMPGPEQAPRDFVEILRAVWWKLDRALDEGSTRASFRAGLLESLRRGVTTVIDHHSSQNYIEGSLGMLAEEARALGVNISVAFELTDRNGEEGFQRGLSENLAAWERFRDRPRVHPMMGLHASFTLSDSSLARVREELREREGWGIHIHVSEDAADEEDARRRGYASVVERLDRFHLLTPHALLAHGLHIRAGDETLLLESGAGLVHNPTSNANNRVGLLPSARIEALKAGLGTDGMQADMLAEAKEGTLVRGAVLRPGEPGVDYTALLFAHNSRIASRLFGLPLGRIAPGYSADLAIYDYAPRTEFTAENAGAHILFGFDRPSDVMASGRFRLRDGRFVDVPEEEILEEARVQSRRLWDAMARL